MEPIQSSEKNQATRVTGYVAVVFAMLFSGAKEFLSDQPDWSNMFLASLIGLGVTRIAASQSSEFDRSDPWLFRILTFGLMLPAIGTIAFRFTHEYQRCVIVMTTATVMIICLWKFEKNAYRKSRQTDVADTP